MLSRNWLRAARNGLKTLLLGGSVAGREPEEFVPRAQIRVHMDAYWTRLGFNAETREILAEDALDWQTYAETVERAKRVWGPLTGWRVLDAGCGWGGLSLQLAREGVTTYFADYVPEHLEATRIRIPTGRGFICDARKLSSLGPEVGPLDAIFLHSVIEHVGNARDHRGEADPSLIDKARIVEEAARLLPPGGRLFLNTGNYDFPLDGEIRVWFFHWLPKVNQLRILDAMKRGADIYGLLTWPQMEKIYTDAGFELERVEPSRTQGFAWFLHALRWLSLATPSIRLSRAQIDEMVELMNHDPRYMPSWNIFLRRTGAAPKPGLETGGPRLAP